MFTQPQNPFFVESKTQLKSNLNSLWIDIAFILDATFSMKTEVNSTRQEMISIIRAIKNKYPEAHVQVGVVIYRDYQLVPHEQYSTLHNTNTDACTVFDFNSNIEKVTAFIQEQPLKNGHDLPEALELALYRTHSLSWRTAHIQSGIELSQLAFLITDAPPHAVNEKAKDEYLDDYPNPKENPAQLYWKEETSKLKAKGIPIHALYAQGIFVEDKNVIEACQYIAKETGGEYQVLDGRDLKKFNETIVQKIISNVFETQTLLKALLETDKQGYHAITTHQQQRIEAVANRYHKTSTCDSDMEVTDTDENTSSLRPM